MRIKTDFFLAGFGIFVRLLSLRILVRLLHESSFRRLLSFLYLGKTEVWVYLLRD